MRSQYLPEEDRRRVAFEAMGISVTGSDAEHSPGSHIALFSIVFSAALLAAAALKFYK